MRETGAKRKKSERVIGERVSKEWLHTPVIRVSTNRMPAVIFRGCERKVGMTISPLIRITDIIRR
jgi:hypothetical protein